MTLLGSLFVPVEGLNIVFLGAGSGVVHLPQTELRLRAARLSSVGVAVKRLCICAGIIMLLTLLEQCLRRRSGRRRGCRSFQLPFCVGMALCGGFLIPMPRLLGVGRNARTGGIHLRQIVLGQHMTLLGGVQVQLCRFDGVHCNALTLLILHRKAELRLLVTQRRGFGILLRRLCVTAYFGVALTGSQIAVRLRCLRRGRCVLFLAESE